MTKLQNLDYLIVLTSVFLGRVIIIGATFPEAVIFLGCVSYLLINKYLKNKEYIPKEDLITPQVYELASKLEETQSTVSALALQAGLKSTR